MDLFVTMTSIKSNHSKGFTLVEIMIVAILLVISIGSLIAVLVGGTRNFTNMSDDSASNHAIHILFSQLNADLIGHATYGDSSELAPLEVGQVSNKIQLSKPVRVDKESGEVIFEEINYEFNTEQGKLFRNGRAYSGLQFEAFEFSVRSRNIDSPSMLKEIMTLLVNYRLDSSSAQSAKKSSLETSFEFNLWNANEKIAFNKWSSPIPQIGQL